jgi:hypothetical protein
MKVEVKIDASCAEVRVIVLTDKITEEVQEVVKKLPAESIH